MEQGCRPFDILIGAFIFDFEKNDFLSKYREKRVHPSVIVFTRFPNFKFWRRKANLRGKKSACAYPTLITSTNIETPLY